MWRSRPGLMCRFLLLVMTAAAALQASPAALAQSAARPVESVDPLVISLAEELATVEATLDAIDGAINRAQRREALRAGRISDLAEMSRPGSPAPEAPLEWQAFLSQIGQQILDLPEPEVAASLEFAEAYRTYRKRRQQAEEQVRREGLSVDELVAQRNRLVSEQAKLWANVTFQALLNRDLGAHPAYRLRLVEEGEEMGGEAQQNIAAIRAAALFVRHVHQVAAEMAVAVDVNMRETLSRMAASTAEARAQLMAQLRKRDAADDLSPLNRLAELADELEDSATRAEAAHREMPDGISEVQTAGAPESRRALQQNLITYAHRVAEADAVLRRLIDSGAVATDPAEPAPPVETGLAELTRRAQSPPPRPRAAKVSGAPADVKQIAELEHRHSAGWQVLFRSSKPLLWNRNHEGVNSEASVELPDEPMQGYIRLKRLDTRDYVILRIGKPIQLGSVEQVDERFYWVGSARLEQRRLSDGRVVENRLLGIANTWREASYHGPYGLMMTTERSSRDGYTGWGFGKHPLVYSDQVFIWDGEIVEPAPMVEIAVKQRDSLSTQEQKRLLNPQVKR